MSLYQKVSLFLLRVSLGWLFFYAGISKILNPAWSAEGFIKTAKTFQDFYASLLDPAVLPVINFINEWGLLLLGVSLILGIFIRLSAPLGAVLMLLYYFPRLSNFKPDANSFIVDQHIVFAAALLYLAAVHAGRTWGLYAWCASLPICKRFPRLRALLD